MVENTSNNNIAEKYNFFAFFSNWLFLAIVVSICFYLFSFYQKAAFKERQYLMVKNEFFKYASDYIPDNSEFYHYSVIGDSLVIGSYTNFAKKEYKIIKKQSIENGSLDYLQDKKKFKIRNPEKFIKVNMIDLPEGVKDHRINQFKVIDNEYVPYSDPIIARSKIENVSGLKNQYLSLSFTDYKYKPNQRKYHTLFYADDKHYKITYAKDQNKLSDSFDNHQYIMIESFDDEGNLMSLLFNTIPPDGKEVTLLEVLFDERKKSIIRFMVYDTNTDFIRYIKPKITSKVRLYMPHSGNRIGLARDFKGNDRLKNGNNSWELDYGVADVYDRMKSFREKADDFNVSIRDYSYKKLININYKYDYRTDKFTKIKKKYPNSTKKKSVRLTNKKSTKSTKKKSTNSTKKQYWNWDSRNERHLLIQFVNKYFSENNGPSMSESDLHIKLIAFFNGNSQKSSNAKGWEKFRKNRRRSAAGISISRLEKIKKNLQAKKYDDIIEENIYRTAKGQELWMELGFPYIFD